MPANIIFTSSTDGRSSNVAKPIVPSQPLPLELICFLLPPPVLLHQATAGVAVLPVLLVLLHPQAGQAAEDGARILALAEREGPGPVGVGRGVAVAGDEWDWNTAA